MKRPLIEYPKERWGFRSSARKLGVERIPASQRSDRQLLVLGTGRSGTTTIAKVLSKAGLDIDRERVASGGTASLYFVVDSDWHPAWEWKSKTDDGGRVHVGERLSDFNFKSVVHVVRNPVKVIPSMGAVFPSLNYEFFEDNNIIPVGIKSQLLRCAHAYYNINKLAETWTDLRIPIEFYNETPHWRRLLRAADLSNVAPAEIPVVANKASGYRKRDPLKWETLHTLDALLCRSVQKMARKYGYG